MCENCERYDRSIDVTEETAPYMISEATVAALHACTFYANGWVRGAEGLFTDMQAKWRSAAVVRMAYVWASAWFFLPRPADAPDLHAGFSEVSAKLERILGEEPPQNRVAQIVTTSDQANAMIKDLTEAASQGELEKFAEIMSGIGDEGLWNAVTALLMGDAGYRVRHARDSEDSRSMELFMAHVNADMPEEDDEEAASGSQASRWMVWGTGGAGDDAED